MHVLNSDLNWSDVANISTGSGNVSDAFQTSFSMPSKEYLRAGSKLYKFNGYNCLTRGELNASTLLSPWWSPVEPFKHDGGLQQRISVANLNGVSLREWGRLTSVIKENWSSMDWLLIVTLKEPVYAWFGGFKSMSRIDENSTSLRRTKLEDRGRSKMLPGGGTQFYIPNFQYKHISFYQFKYIN